MSEQSPFPFLQAVRAALAGESVRSGPNASSSCDLAADTPSGPVEAVADQPLADPYGDFGAFRLQGILSAGGTSVVYRGVHQQTGQRVAVKILRPSVAEQTAFVEMVFREAQTLRNLRHPNIVDVLGYGVHAGLPFVLLEEVDGVTLAHLIEMLELDRAQWRHIVKHVCDAVAYLHAKGFVHCDLKPSHIHVSREGVVKLTDFGSACACASLGSFRFGTGFYVAPELVAGTHPITPAADIFSLGVTFYRMFTGQIPLPEQRVPAHELNPCVPQEIDAVLVRALAFDPDQRFASVEEFSNALLQALK